MTQETLFLIDHFQKGGPVMWPLLLLSLLSMALIIERFWYYRWANRLDCDFLKEFEKLASRGKVELMVSLCDRYGGPLATTLARGIEKKTRDRERVERVMQQTGASQLVRLERGLGVLSSIGNIAPLLGFLGTVIGMIKAFDVIAWQGLHDPSLVAIGIKEALITTATGLIIAIPTIAAFNYFTIRVASFISRIEEQSNRLLEMLSD